jgi:hypothetical protein
MPLSPPLLSGPERRPHVKHLTLHAVALSLLLAALPAALSAEAGGSYSIRGSVTAPSGRPAGSVWVVLERDGNAHGRALTADDGRYYVSRLQSGAYVILVRRGESTLYRAQVSLPGDAVHEIVLR